ncbi:MAG: hypothetical protein ACREP6_16000, partial [Candidatus Binataceae bacterium]
QLHHSTPASHRLLHPLIAKAHGQRKIAPLEFSPSNHRRMRLLEQSSVLGVHRCGDTAQRRVALPFVMPESGEKAG